VSAASHAARIAELNDQLRERIQMPVFGKAFPPGAIYLTQGVAALGPEAQIIISAMVRDFDAFENKNDPYGERDFGSIDTEFGGRIFWKIDYYADERCEFGSEDPSDPEKSFRVLTIMLAEEY
jgi:hypothetical protein